jgi:hypothetical protein
MRGLPTSAGHIPMPILRCGRLVDDRLRPRQSRREPRDLLLEPLRMNGDEISLRTAHLANARPLHLQVRYGPRLTVDGSVFVYQSPRRSLRLAQYVR